MIEDASATKSAAPVLLVTIEEAARLLSIGKTSLRELIASGQLEAVRIGRCRRIRLEALRSFVDDLPTLEEVHAAWSDPRRYSLGLPSDDRSARLSPVTPPDRRHSAGRIH
jgi:excisionase family DNA binding protein